MHRYPSAIAAIVFVVVIAPALPTTVRGLTRRAQAAHDIRKLPASARGRVMLGWQDTIARDLGARTRAEDSIDFVMATSEARDLAVLTATYLAPRPIRFFQGMDAWQRRERATFFHDDRAANAPNRVAPGTAAVTVVLDPRRDPPYFILGAPR